MHSLFFSFLPRFLYSTCIYFPLRLCFSYMWGRRVVWRLQRLEETLGARCKLWIKVEMNGLAEWENFTRGTIPLELGRVYRDGFLKIAAGQDKNPMQIWQVKALPITCFNVMSCKELYMTFFWRKTFITLSFCVACDKCKSFDGKGIITWCSHYPYDKIWSTFVVLKGEFVLDIKCCLHSNDEPRLQHQSKPFCSDCCSDLWGSAIQH